MKKNLIILILAVIVLVVIIILTVKANPVTINNTEDSNLENSQFVGIEAEIDSINVDAEIDEDMKSIDADLENL